MPGAQSPEEASAGYSAAKTVAWAIARYAPCSCSERAAALARELVAKASPPSAQRARNLLFAASRLASFAESVGLELSTEELLNDALIERFILQATKTCSPATRRTLRASLHTLSRAHEAHPRPRPVSLPRERAKAPYSSAEIAGYLALADAQSTVSRRMRATALVCLGAGAGIVAGELRHIRGCDVLRRSGGVIVMVSGKRARCVPVRARFCGSLLASARFAGDGFIVGGRDPARRNVTDALCGALCADPALPRLQAGRLRSTWLHEAAQAIGLHAFMAAAGIRCSQRLGDITASVSTMDEPEMVALLGAAW